MILAVRRTLANDLADNQRPPDVHPAALCQPQHIVITTFIPFWRLVIFIKWALAAIPATIVVTVIFRSSLR